MPFTIVKCKLFRIKNIALLEGETFLINKHEIVFFEIKCTFFGRKENTISDVNTFKFVIIRTWYVPLDQIRPVCVGFRGIGEYDHWFSC